MKPFLLIGTRPEDVVADSEYDAVRRFAGLGAEQLLRVRLEAGPMPPLELDTISGVIIGGSPFNASDPEHEKSATQVRVEAELATLLDALVADEVPFLGACYGVGTLGVHQGGVVDRTYGEPVGAVPVTLTEAGRADPLFAGVPDTFTAFVGHKEAVLTPPPGAVVLATSPGCPVQAFRVGPRLYATQFHPELDLGGLTVRIHAYKDAGYFPAETAPEVIAEAGAHVVEHPQRVLANFVRMFAR